MSYEGIYICEDQPLLLLLVAILPIEIRCFIIILFLFVTCVSAFHLIIDLYCIEERFVEKIS